MKDRSPIFVVCSILFAFLGSCIFAETVPAVGTDAVWSPGMTAIQTIHQQCDNSSNFSDCFVGYLQKSGASLQVINFVKMTDNTGYLRDFRKVGPVDVAYVNFPFRANENQGCYLVNGTPSPIDVDNLQALPQSELDKNPAYQQLAKQYPNISLWPGDRSGTDYPAIGDLPAGGKSFVFRYIFRDLCHACAVIGSVSFAFDFDPTDKLQGIHLSSIQAKGDTGQQFSDPSKPIQIAAGQQFSIVLDSNRTTGYQWQLSKPLNAAILQKVDNIYESPQTNLTGAGGKDLWTFKAVAAGKTSVQFQYVRPWEKNVAPVKTSTFEITVQ